ncbi:MAG TPA: hypothetical protein VF286_00950, partial [Acidiphilium sp.]
ALGDQRAEVLRLLVDPAIIVLCARCGTASRRFIEVVNPEGWTCERCSPDWQAEAMERDAIAAEGRRIVH